MTAGNSLKIYLRNEMVNKRAELGITQEKMLFVICCDK